MALPHRGALPHREGRVDWSRITPAAIRYVHPVYRIRNCGVVLAGTTTGRLTNKNGVRRGSQRIESKHMLIRKWSRTVALLALVVPLLGVSAPAGVAATRAPTPTEARALAAWQLLDNNRRTVDIVAAAGQLYQRHHDGKVWRYTGKPLTGWQLLDNNPRTVDIVAAAGQLYQRHHDGTIWRMSR